MQTRALESSQINSEREKKVLYATSRLAQRPKTNVILHSTNIRAKAAIPNAVVPIDNSFKFSSFPKRKMLRTPVKKSSVFRISSSRLAKKIEEITRISKSCSFENGIQKFPLPKPNLKEIDTGPNLISHYGISLTRLIGC